MHRQKCYDTCQRYFGKVVRIEDRDGRIHLGKIIDVTKSSVWIEPVQQRSSFDTGFGYYDAYANGGCDLCGALADVIVVDLVVVVDSAAVDVAVVVAVVVAAGEAAVVDGVLNSDLVSSSELH